MYSKQTLKEGLRPADLAYLVKNEVSIDEVTGKLDKDNIVTIVYCMDKNASFDLKSFLEKGNFDILDAELSAASDKFGYYSLFLELERNILFPKRIIKITNYINKLCPFKQWKFISYGSDKSKDLTIDNIKQNVRLLPIDVANQIQESKIKKFFSKSSLNNILYSSKKSYNELILEDYNKKKHAFEIVGFLKKDLALKTIKTVGIKLEENFALGNHLENVLGENYNVVKTKDFVFINYKDVYLQLKG